MALSISPTKSQIQTALNSFLGSILPGVLVVAGVDNLVPEPASADFVVLTPIRFVRLATNIDSYQDCKFVGSIEGTEMTVDDVELGTVEIGNTVFGPGVTANTVISAQTSGTTGGPGTYTVAPAQIVAAGTLSAGTMTLLQEVQVTVQLDVHGPNSGDNAQIISTTFRDEFATDFFAGLAAPLNSVSPLLADDPKYLQFINAEQQFEFRWSIDAQIQVNQTVTIPLQFFDSATITAASVEAILDAA